MRSITALVLAATISIPAWAGELTVDGSSQVSFEASVREMIEDMSDEDAKTFSAGLMNIILTEYPPAKGQDGLSLLFFGEEAVKAAPRTLDGKTKAEIIERGRGLSGAKLASADDRAASEQERVLDCLRQAVVVQDAKVKRGDFSPSLNLTIANRLSWPISGIRFHYAVRTKGRTVPWAEEEMTLAIAGGIEPGEVRTIGVSLFSMSNEAREPFVTQVTISDVADQDKRQLIGDIRIIDWGSERSSRTCDAEDAAPTPTLSDGPEDPDGAPLTPNEKHEFLLALQRCWNVPAGLRSAQQLKVTLGAQLTAQGEIIASSIRLVDPSSPSDGPSQQLYEATRRALLRCGPYILPSAKHAQWRNIKVVANLEGIVSW